MATLRAEAAIYEALVDKVSSVARALGLSPDLGGEVSFPGVSFTPPVAKQNDPGVKKGDRLPYLAVTYMPNGAALDGLPFDSDVTHQGLLQISVFWPAGAGLVKPYQLAAQVVAAFPPGLWIERNGTVVRIDRSPEVAGALQESDFAQIPVTIRWRAGIAAAA